MWWQEQDRRVLRRVNMLIRDILRSPYEGVGKPEVLRRDLAGVWSRRINDEHRLVYEIVIHDDEETLRVLACRYHYDK